MKTSLAFPLAITFALVLTGCSSRQAGDLTSGPVVPLAMNDQPFTFNGIPMPTPFDKEQPVAQQFTPHAKKNYLVETVIADTWVMNVYEVSATGERKTIGAPKKDAGTN